MSLSVEISSEVRGIKKAGLSDTIEAAALAVLDAEGVEFPCQIGVLLTDDRGIRRVNWETRRWDKPTDVLSFPMLEITEGERYVPETADYDPDSKRVYLGDIVVSLERVSAQALEYGHSFDRELSYMVIHSVLHMLGYDHVDEAEGKKRMRVREKAVLKSLNL